MLNHLELTLLGVAILIMFLAMLYAGIRTRARYNIPRGESIYEDMLHGGKILRSTRYGLSGKPDRVIRRGGRLIVYEYKSGNAPTPRDGHVLQLGTYFIILQDLYPELTVSYGIINYRNQAFRIDNTRMLRERVIRVSENIREISSSGLVPLRNHGSVAKCLRCPFNDICSQSLIIA